MTHSRKSDFYSLEKAMYANSAEFNYSLSSNVFNIHKIMSSILEFENKISLISNQFTNQLRLMDLNSISSTFSLINKNYSKLTTLLFQMLEKFKEKHAEKEFNFLEIYNLNSQDERASESRINFFKMNNSQLITCRGTCKENTGTIQKEQEIEHIRNSNIQKPQLSIFCLNKIQKSKMNKRFKKSRIPKSQTPSNLSSFNKSSENLTEKASKKHALMMPSEKLNIENQKNITNAHLGEINENNKVIYKIKHNQTELKIDHKDESSVRRISTIIYKEFEESSFSSLNDIKTRNPFIILEICKKINNSILKDINERKEEYEKIPEIPEIEENNVLESGTQFLDNLKTSIISFSNNIFERKINAKQNEEFSIDIKTSKQEFLAKLETKLNIFLDKIRKKLIVLAETENIKKGTKEVGVAAEFNQKIDQKKTRSELLDRVLEGKMTKEEIFNTIMDIEKEKEELKQRIEKLESEFYLNCETGNELKLAKQEKSNLKKAQSESNYFESEYLKIKHENRNLEKKNMELQFVLNFNETKANEF